MTRPDSDSFQKKTTLAEIGALVGGIVEGNGSLEILGMSSLEDAGEGQLSFLADLKQVSRLEKTRAAAVIVPSNLPPFPKPLIRTSNPYAAYAKVQTFFSSRPYVPLGIDPRAFVGTGAEIGAEVSIYPFVYVGSRSRIGSRVVLYPGVYVGEGAEVGEGTILYPNVVVMDRCRIGRRVIVHGGTVIGSDGFGFAPDKSGYVKIPQVGIVEIEDDVEIGANCAIDRAAMGRTWIRKGVKTDNLVQIAHNVVVGENTVLVAQVGIAGSTEIGKWVALGGQVGVVGHIKIGDQARVGAQAGVAHDVKVGETLSGSPAFPHREWLKAQAVFPRLPEIKKNLAALEKRVAELEKMSGNPENEK
ncbi:MAG: lpxD [Deltaproteobacteria bacterium]|jgi:UDP-3-O-[3-hydroxymyristoyl] glucosamine N-acyltransferase|nr:lpxD [Deltaproteobacteria bacterium]